MKRQATHLKQASLGSLALQPVEKKKAHLSKVRFKLHFPRQPFVLCVLS